MKNQKLDYNSIIGMFLIFLILIIFTFISENQNIEHHLKNRKTIHFFQNKRQNQKQNFSYLENNVLRVKISNKGGMINEILLKKYKSYNSNLSSHVKNLFLVSNSSFLYNISFSNKKDYHFDTQDLNFYPIVNKKKKYYQIIIMRARNPYEKGFIYHIYKLGNQDQYIIDFSIKTKKLKSFNKLISLNLEQKILPLEKDRNWENSYTQTYYSSFSNNSDMIHSSIKCLSEKKTDAKNIYDVNWIAHKQQFFTTIIVPNKILDHVFIYSKHFFSGYSLKGMKMHYIFSYTEKNKEFNYSFRFYFSPLDFNLLKKYESGFENMIPFGWGFLKWINKYFFLTIFQLLEKTKLNYGIIVILMTIVVKMILFPITYKQYKLSSIMKLIRPKIEELNNKYKNSDILMKQKEMMKLYREAGINPMSGCISTLFQIPIFYSLFKFFPTIINLRGKSFLWVDDLTSYDSIVKLPFHIPFYGNHVSLLTILYSLVLFVYTKLTNNGKQDGFQDDSYPNMDWMLYIMPFIMLLFINNYASALSLYYFTSNVINIIFLFFIKKFVKITT
ncbi:YidC/Oxa1 family insertase periplasmic-domain containing protein [Blattabacterium cuenoti]|uniref:YidC/Oxa1 family insertase periplasmic-domain containing protein n=1 Tax=Blattabacterium cuenoti TaxID=1653831 RepID=UPI00163BFF05|nr:YidC/Oxa1 family insertase periplasmic-domain containing protein [Blattabacterium cuenoti]